MKVRGIVALSMLAALAVLAVACGAAGAEVKVDKGLAAIAGVNSASLQRQSNQGAESAASTSLGGADASATYAGQLPATGGTAAARSAGADLSSYKASSGGSLAPLEQVGPLGIVVQGYGRATAPADTARVQFVVDKSGDVYAKPLPSEPTVIPEGSAEGGTASVPPLDVWPTPPPIAPLTEADLQPLVDTIKAQGVSESDIEVTIYPSNDYPGYATPTARVTATLRDTSKVGSLIDAVNQKTTLITAANQAVAGSGTIYIANVGVIYSVNDCDALLKEARKAAVQDARNNGAGLAEALGVGLGDVQGATEYSSYDSYGNSSCQPQSGQVYYPYEGPSYDPAQPAEVQIVSNVTISFAMS